MPAQQDLEEYLQKYFKITPMGYLRLRKVHTPRELVTCMTLLNTTNFKSLYRQKMASRLRDWLRDIYPEHERPLQQWGYAHCEPTWPTRAIEESIAQIDQMVAFACSQSGHLETELEAYRRAFEDSLTTTSQEETEDNAESQPEHGTPDELDAHRRDHGCDEVRAGAQRERQEHSEESTHQTSGSAPRPDQQYPVPGGLPPVSRVEAGLCRTKKSPYGYEVA